ncbi:UNVERIFIED_CONTAM: Retrovirus-related Pol polyprotein from transposon RE1 [Sesamum indicum]
MCLAAAPKCTCGGCSCGVNKGIAERDENTQLMQFLMGLHESFDNGRSQILMHDPLPDLERAFSMIFTVEKLRAVHTDLEDSSWHMAYQLMLKDGRKEQSDKSISRKKPFVDRRRLVCSHCQKPGHTLNNCFQIHGIPEWYKTMHDAKKKGNENHNFAATAVEEKGNSGDGLPTKNTTELMSDLIKLLKGNNLPADPITTYANFTCHDEENFAAPFDLVYLDVWGPYKTYTISNCAYVLTILDDYSRSLWTYLINHKSQVFPTLKSFLAMSLCDELGIIHQPSYTYTPQQNGRVERKHRHLLNVARALLFQASLPLKFLGDSIVTATYLINRTPSPILHWKSPFERLHNYPPTYDHLRTFGCLCYATDGCPSKSKFHRRAIKCILLGYAMSQKAYKLFDLNNESIIFSRDVQFFEYIFPFSTSIPTHEMCPLPLVPSHYDIMQPASSHYFDFSLVPPSIPFISASSPSSAGSPASNPATLPLRRSSRVSQRPSWLNDFVCSIHNPHSLHSPAPAYLSFVASLSILQEPKSFSDAVQHQEWREAMDAEIRALEQNHIETVTSLPSGKRAIGCKWVFKTKLRANDSVERYKARLVAKGFNQIEGVDYTDSFSLVVKNVTVRVFLAVAAAHGYSIAPGLVCKLEQSSYGLKQASRQWNVEFTHKLKAYSFLQSAEDHCLFIKQTVSGPMALLVYVDDILIPGPSISDIHSDGLFVAQNKYVLDIIQDTGLCHAKSTSTPLPHGLKLVASSGALLSNPDAYRRLVGRLLYLGFTHPDISHSVQQLSNALVSWKTKKQSTVSRSTAEVEYRSLAATVCELRWLSFILADLSVPAVLPVDLFCDNKAALHILANPVFHERTKHIELDCHLVRDAYKEGFISPSFVPSSLQLADVFTKVLPLKSFSNLISKLGLAVFSHNPTCGGADGIQSLAAAQL